jgi:peptide/nickel transport system permease protein
MGHYVLGRLAAMLPVLLLVSVVIFSLIHLTPGDPATVMLGAEASLEDIQRVRQELGLDQPLYLQYLHWLGRVLRGDLGHSIRTHQPVAEAILQRLPVTIEVALAALTVSLAIALPTGMVSALRRDSAVDASSRALALLGVSVPSFFLAILLIYVFSLKLRWLPPIGFVPLTADPVGNVKSVLMPALTLGAALAAVVARLTRSSLLEVLDEGYVRTARAKGLREGVMVRRHALKNALIPVVTVVGLQSGTLLGGAIITETVFALPGVGRLIVDSVFQRDFPLVQGVVLFLALIFLGVNLLVDLVYAWLDPRIHYA